MWSLQSLSVLLCSVFLLCSSSMEIVSGTWLTRKGDKPLVIASGGFSGMFPACSAYAYSLAVSYSLPNSLVSCDVHLTKDGDGICFPNINLQNGSSAAYVYPNGGSTYDVNGKSKTGWFSLDFKLDELQENVCLTQGIYCRTPIFDGQNMTTVDDVLKLQPPAGVWLSVSYAEFYKQHNLSMTDYVRSVSQSCIVKYISSPEVAFLKTISSYKLVKNKPKLVFQFLGVDDVEPLTKKTYGDLLKDLACIKGFADGILVPKEYIQPMDINNYLTGPATNLVSDAHAAGLDVFASGFANDASDFAYDYSYDPVLEYLGFVDNGQFAVDGVFSDFPITPSAAIDCFAGIGKNDVDRVNVTVISNEGASGDLPASTDAAYMKAVSDGANVIDCSVQMTKDLILFCMGSINISERIDLKSNSGVFAYDHTWKQIQGSTTSMSDPYACGYILFRNPRGNGVGKFMKLDEFLGYANNQSSLSGVLISIEDAPYQAKNMNLTDAVSKALTNSGYNKKVMIRSSEPAVLKYFQNTNNKYEKVYVIDRNLSHVTQLSKSNISDISTFASSVVLSKNSVFPLNSDHFIINGTEIVSQLKAFGLSVYVQLFRNEFISQAWDYLSDPTVEINTHVSMGIDGIITDFPATAARYKKNRCLGMNPRPSYMTPVWSPNQS